MYKELTTWLTMQTLFSSQHNQLRCWISCCATPKGVSRQIIYLLFFPCFSTEMTSSEPDLNFHFELIRYTTVFLSSRCKFKTFEIYSYDNNSSHVKRVHFNRLLQENAHRRGYQRTSIFTFIRISRDYVVVNNLGCCQVLLKLPGP